MQKQRNIKFKWRLMQVGLSTLALAALAPVATSYAVDSWGPERPTYTMKKPADHPTFNSITDNNVIGDERDFVRVAEKGGKKWLNEVKMVPGKTYQVFIFYHNNAASNLDEGGKGYAQKAKIRSSFPTKVNSSAKGKVSATISSTTTTPKEVYDVAFFTTDSKADVSLEYVLGSAIIYNQGKLNGTVLSRELFSTGDYIGFNKLSGVLPGCSEYSGHIIYEVKAKQTSSKSSKSVSLDGKNFFSSVTAKPGDTVTYKISFSNTGSETLNDVTFRDVLPKGVTFVSGSIKLYNDATKSTRSLTDALVKNGVNTGKWGKGVSGTITYQVKVDKDIVKDGDCGTNLFKNTVRTTTNETGSATSTATIKVEKTCEEPPKDPCLNEDGTVKTECCDQEKYKDLPQCKEEPDPCLNEDGTVKTECCDQEKYKDLPQCSEKPDPCLNEDGSVKTECCDQEKYKDLPQCKKPDPCLNDDGSVKTECCDKEEYKDLPQCKKDEPKPTPYLPNTGPGEIALAIVAAFCVVTGVTYWYRSQKEVAEVQKEVKHGNGEHKQ